MSRRLWSFIAGLVALCCLDVALAQPPEMPKPSPEHAYLKKYVGTWDATMKMGPMESKGVQTSKMLGDFWLVGSFDGEFGGMKFSGQETMGWDPIKKKYVNTWIDSMAPHVTHMMGDFDAGSKTLSMSGGGIGMEGKHTKNKTTTVWKSDDEILFTMSEEKEGKMTEMFTITYKRRK